MKNTKLILVILVVTTAAVLTLLVLRGPETEQQAVRSSTALADFREEAAASGQEQDATAPDVAESVNADDPSSDNSTALSNTNNDAATLGAGNAPATQAASQAEATDRDSVAEDDPAAPRLSQQVLEVVTEVQARQLDGQWEEALNEMNALYLAFDELNPFEQATLLNFYTNTLLQLEMYQESISAFDRLLTIPELRPDVNARAILALGQLHNRVDEPDAAVSYYEQWLAFTAGMPGMEQQTQRVQQLLTQARAATER
ncbi:MAG: hypothetical protein R3F50_10925 [Gammaproteobacteria bacterium]|jgi:tetratricopeptide (TPR) repeat protein